MGTLYDKLGGEEAVERAVDKFYEKVLADKRIQRFFAHIDSHQHKQHQKAFMTYAFGDALHWNGCPMRDAHQGIVADLGLSDSDFDALTEDLVETLVELKVPQTVIDEVLAIVSDPTHRADVLNR